jgi:hypothetical protein
LKLIGFKDQAAARRLHLKGKRGFDGVCRKFCGASWDQTGQHAPHRQNECALPHVACSKKSIAATEYQDGSSGTARARSKVQSLLWWVLLG